MNSVAEELSRAVALREDGCLEEARTLLIHLSSVVPDDVQIAYQTAWIHDVLGLERQAIPFYIKALDGEGLSTIERRGALLGLGSTYRSLGMYTEAVDVLDAGVTEFPDDRAIAVFLAMSRYNTGEAKEAVSELLALLIETVRSELATPRSQ